MFSRLFKPKRIFFNQRRFKFEPDELATKNFSVRYEPTAKKRFVGFHENPLKFDVVWPRLPHERPGIQGTDHLLPGKGRIAERLPIKMKLKKDHKYFWCACGHSNHQPLCDGSHNREATKLRPVAYIAEEDSEVWLCACKQTNNRPFCDGSHKKLPPPEDEQFLVSGLVKKKKK